MPPRVLPPATVVARQLFGQREELATSGRWRLAELNGRLCELSSGGRLSGGASPGGRSSAVLTMAFRLVLDAQQQGETVAWVTVRDRCFYPPDVAEGGVDLVALVVVRVAQAPQIARAADFLARSGAFGLVVLDLASARADIAIPPALQSRLLGLAQKHRLAVVCLTDESDHASSIGSLVSLRAHAQRVRAGPDRHRCVVTVRKDKRRPPGWTHDEVCRGPAGLR